MKEKLAKLKLIDPIDFVMHLPYKYENECEVISISQALKRMGTVMLEVIVDSVHVVQKKGRRLQIVCHDDTDMLCIHIMNPYPRQEMQFIIGKRIRVRGELKAQTDVAVLFNPFTYSAEQPLSEQFTPIYASVTDLPQSYLRKCIYKYVDEAKHWPQLKQFEQLLQPLFKQYFSKLSITSLIDAFKTIHQPHKSLNFEQLNLKQHAAWQCIKAAELVAQQLSLKQVRYLKQTHISEPFNNLDLQAFMAQLPFTLTDEQNKVWQEIEQDLQKTQPMHRLLQGDVGSGKTVIAMMLATCAVKNGYQVAIMAPTEILANQLKQKCDLWCEPLGINCAYLVGSTTAKQKKLIKEALNLGTIDMVVGTHALIQDDVNFKNLGLLVIDEQHRFGVEQRLALKKQHQTVHQLMMSATPIPRTLSMTYYADLDVSCIYGLPPNRQPIQTKLISNKQRDILIQRLHKMIEQEKRQIYWVCPLIEESETLNLQTAEQSFADITQALPNARCALLHGKIKAKDKQAIMQAFKQGDLDILVATTVIEVGVDVPNASIMIIEEAQRFGLAQLHQLRGRVGRGEVASICILLYQEPLSFIANQRLAIMQQHSDGFLIAQKDLELRGAGELLGTKQSGDQTLRFFDLQEDIHLIEPCQKISQYLLQTQAQPVIHQYIALWFKHKQILLGA